MAGKVKGIVVEIGGDTSGLQEALKKVNSMTSSLSKELKGINSLLKFDPKNTDLLKQKQALLKEEIQATDNKLQNLLFHQEQIAKSGVTLTEDQQKNYRALQREIVLTQEKLKTLQAEASRFNQVADRVRAVGTAMKNFGDKVTEVGKKVSVLSGAVAGLLAVGVKYNANLETSTKAFETFTGSAEESKRAIDEIRKDSRKSLFDTNALVKANQYLISTGVDAEKSRKTINGLADAIALTGGGNDELNRMALNLQQIQNVGKASATDIKQFAMAGIDVYGILADTLGVTTEEVKNMDISFEDLSNALIIASSEGGKYYQGQQTMADTLNGKIAMLKKTFEELMGSIATSLMPVLDTLTTHIQNIVNWFNSLDDSQKQTIATILGMVAVAGPLILILGKLISTIGTLFIHIGNIIGIAGKLFTFITGTFIPVLTKVISGLFTLIMAHPIIAIITVIIGALVLLYNKCEWFRNAVNNVVKAVWNFFANFGENMKKLFTETIPNFIKSAINFFSTLPSKIGYILGFAIGKLVKFGADALKWCIENVPKIILNIVNFFATLPSRIGQILVNALISFGQGLINMIHKAREILPHVVASIVDGLRQVIPHILNIGRNIVEGLWNGIFNAKAWLRQKVGEFAKGILDGMKDALGIHSPSVLFEKVVGKNIALGIGKGFDKNISGVVKDMASQVTGATGMFDVEMTRSNQAPITLNFYPQQMTEAELDMTFNYVNRRLGTQY